MMMDSDQPLFGLEPSDLELFTQAFSVWMVSLLQHFKGYNVD